MVVYGGWIHLLIIEIITVIPLNCILVAFFGILTFTAQILTEKYLILMGEGLG